MIQLPNIIYIAGVPWKVRDRRRTDPDLRGETDYRNQEIWVDAKAGGAWPRKTLLHEVIHAVDDGYRGTQPHISEARVISLENGLFDVFNSNPGLARLIFGKNA